jgi:signal transduction histidine kinase
MGNMVDRVAGLDGSLEVRSAPGRGTEIAGRVPLPVAEALA